MLQLFPLLYGATFVLLLVQAFLVMARGFGAVPRPGDRHQASPQPLEPPSAEDRTGRLTVHPELLDGEGRLVQDNLLTVRFSGGTGESPVPPEPS